MSSSGDGDTGAAAFGALSYDVPEGATVGKLTLTVAPNSATTPSTTLELCPLTSQSFKPEEGGAMSDAPSYSCAHNVTAAPTSSSYQFDVSSLVSSGSLAVAILPTSPSDRVVLSQPDTKSLDVQAPADNTLASPANTRSFSNPGPASGTDTSSASGTGSVSGTGPAPTSVPADTGAAAPSISGIPVTPVSSPSAPPSLAQPGSTTSPSTSGTSVALVASAATSGGPKPWVGLIFLAVLLLAGALWMGASRSTSAEQTAP